MTADFFVPLISVGNVPSLSSDLIAIVATGAETWVMTSPDGRFDANSVQRLTSVQWVMSDDPLRALPLELFVRDYYEPRLLARLKACRAGDS